jgi:hypothetical protein
MCESYNKIQFLYNTGKPGSTHLYYSSFKTYAMPLLTILIVLIVVGVILWLVNTYIPMDRKIKNILNIVVVIVVVIWLLQAFGVMGSLRSLKV